MPESHRHDWDLTDWLAPCPGCERSVEVERCTLCGDLRLASHAMRGQYPRPRDPADVLDCGGSHETPDPDDLIHPMRETRDRLSLTQVALAERLGVHPNTVARLERGELDLSPSWRARLRLLADAEGIV